MSAAEKVVGIGSSAGGLQALCAALGSVSPDLPYAYVVAQHMSPDSDSPLVELLSRSTALTVVAARNDMLLEAGVVAVCPPHLNIAVADGRLVLKDPSETAGPHPTIDLLLDSLAHSHGTDAVAVILSGSGADGAQGAQEVHAAGGVVIAQSARSAEFDAMPNATVATGCVDSVIDASELGEILARLPGVCDPTVGAGDHIDHIGGRPGLTTGPKPNQGLRPVLEELRAVTGIDFSEYKQGTLERQVARRQALTGRADTDGYRDLVLHDEDEVRQLAAAILVTVTGFFRDPDSWTALTNELKKLWRRGDDVAERRIWVAGCATGEEAYTVAMVAAEVQGRTADLADCVKVFATDLREDALTTARRGVYSDAAVAGIPPPMRDMWWRRGSTGWEVSPNLRDAVVFARHNLNVDPPFPRLDLVTVRNTLIYFQSPLQKRALSVIQFALQPDGLLLLGQSERIGDPNPHFDVVDATHRIYRRTEQDSRLRMAPSVYFRDTLARPTHPPAALQDSLLAALLPPSLIIDSDDDVIDVVGDVSPWCWVAPGPPSRQVVALVRAELRVPVSSLIMRLRHGDRHEVGSLIETPEGPVELTARLVGDDHPGLAIVCFRRDAGGEMAVHASAPVTADVETVTRELETTQAALHATVEDLSASNEELRALNEELQASSEESQSANEELQASNEELSTLNQELHLRTADLVSAKSDLENIQASVSAGLVVVDERLRIARFTAPAVRVFALIDGDVGRELTSIPTTVTIPGLESALREAVDRGSARITNAAGQGNDYLVQIRPHRDDNGRIQGAIVVITDTTQLAAAQREMASALQRLNAVTDSLDDAVWQRDASGGLLLLSKGVEQLFGLDRDRVMEEPSLLRAAIHRDDRERVDLATSVAGQGWDVEYRIVRPDGDIRQVRESAKAAQGDHGVTTGIIRDVSERAITEQIASHRRQILEAFFALHAPSVVLLDDDGKILRTNRAFVELSQYEPSALIGMPLSTLIVGRPPLRPAAADNYSDAVHRQRLADRSGNLHWVSLEMRALPRELSADAQGSDEAARYDSALALVVLQDLTPHMEVTEDLERRIRYDDQTGVLARSEFIRRVDQEISRLRRTNGICAALWIDLDGFKEVNDMHGHRAGDLVLAKVAERLTATTRGKENVGRLGGDEFGIVVSDLDTVDGLELACERVLAAVREPTVDGDTPLFVTASVGVAVAPEDGDTAETLLHNADTAMYSAKKAHGDRREYFQAAMNEAARVRGQQRGELAAAVRAGDFCMHYQPIMDMVADEVVAVEALIRMRSDDAVPAEQFIDRAREAGLLRAIGRIGRNALDDDLEIFAAHPSLASLPVSINLAVEELEDRDLTKQIMAWTPPGGIRRLSVEVTEQSLLPDSGQAMETLELLQRLGAHIWIDDFGTGYSNLALLQRLRPEKIKVDGSLLLRAADDPRGRQLLTASLEMIRALEADPIVEGVESREQFDLLRDLGVRSGQGYLFAHPMPADRLVAWMSQRSS